MNLEPGIEARGGDVSNHFFKAFRLVPTIAYRIFTKHGMGRFSDEGRFVADLRPWWPLEPYLAALFEINDAVGSAKMVEIGKLIEKHVSVPPSMRDIRTTFASIDVAYHLNHRKHGKPMFDLASGRMTDGIGHYVYNGEESGNFFTMETDAPYPCDVDRGILSGFARRFEPRSFVEHAAGRCRKQGNSVCVFEVSW